MKMKNGKKGWEASCEKNGNENSIHEKYKNAIKEGPTCVCICCGQLFFQKGVKKRTPHIIPSKMAPSQKSLKIEYDEQCVSLNRYLENHSNTMSALSTDECFRRRRHERTPVVGFDYPPVFFTGGKDSLGNDYPPVKNP